MRILSALIVVVLVLAGFGFAAQWGRERLAYTVADMLPVNMRPGAATALRVVTAPAHYLQQWTGVGSEAIAPAATVIDCVGQDEPWTHDPRDDRPKAISDTVETCVDEHAAPLPFAEADNLANVAFPQGDGGCTVRLSFESEAFHLTSAQIYLFVEGGDERAMATARPSFDTREWLRWYYAISTPTGAYDWRDDLPAGSARDEVSNVRENLDEGDRLTQYFDLDEAACALVAEHGDAVGWAPYRLDGLRR